MLILLYIYNFLLTIKYQNIIIFSVGDTTIQYNIAVSSSLRSRIHEDMQVVSNAIACPAFHMFSCIAGIISEKSHAVFLKYTGRNCFFLYTLFYLSCAVIGTHGKTAYRLPSPCTLPISVSQNVLDINVQ